MSASQEKLRFGICGLGFMGRTYFHHLCNHPRASVVAVCDRDPQLRAGDWAQATGNIGPRAGQRVDLGGATAYSDPQELIGDPDVDVVAVTLPTPLHAPVTEQALAAGRHVLCEKPMARDLEGCDRMIWAAEQAGRTLMIAQCVRFWPQYEAIKRLVDEGRLGPLRFAKLKRVTSPPLYSSQNWLMDGRQSGGALLDLHVHDTDFAHHLLGMPESIFARGTRGPSGEIDHVLATYSYADGRYALIEGGWAHHHAPWPFEMAISVFGERGAAQWSSQRGPEVLLYAGADEVQRIDCADEAGWMHELDYFIDRVVAGQPVERCLPASSRTSVALALLEKQAIESGGAVRVSPTATDCSDASRR
nr:dehydrogenase [uncultured bacterium]